MEALRERGGGWCRRWDLNADQTSNTNVSVNSISYLAPTTTLPKSPETHPVDREKGQKRDKEEEE